MEFDSIAYGQIARWYDTYVQTTFDIPFFLQEARKSGGKVLELMSGTGRVSIPLVKAGIELTCVDRSPEMLALLREKLENSGLQAEVIEMDVRNLDLDQQFNLAIIPFHSFAELISPADQLKALMSIHHNLIDGGRFICTLQNPLVRLQTVDGQVRLWKRSRLENGEGLLVLFGVENYDPDRQVVNGMQFFEQYDSSGVMVTRRVLEIKFHLMDQSQFEEIAREAGFKINGLYGDYSYNVFDENTSPYMIWFLEKG